MPKIRWFLSAFTTVSIHTAGPRFKAGSGRPRARTGRSAVPRARHSRTTPEEAVGGSAGGRAPRVLTMLFEVLDLAAHGDEDDQRHLADRAPRVDVARGLELARTGADAGTVV